jgi:ATP-binding cassette, subfamily D (ALD), member 2
MNDKVYYSVVNLDNRITNADQCLTEDIKMFCDNLAHGIYFYKIVHSQISKPILDIVLNLYQLSKLASQSNAGNGIPSFIGAFAIIYGTGKLLKFFRPKFGKLVSEQAEKEGQLRFTHSRIITNCEEISFLRGNKVEHGILLDRYP